LRPDARNQDDPQNGDSRENEMASHAQPPEAQSRPNVRTRVNVKSNLLAVEARAPQPTTARRESMSPNQNTVEKYIDGFNKSMADGCACGIRWWPCRWR
jgi:hypothetical protein